MSIRQSVEMPARFQDGMRFHVANIGSLFIICLKQTPLKPNLAEIRSMIEDSSEASFRTCIMDQTNQTGLGPAANAPRDRPNLVFPAAVARLKLLFWGRSPPFTLMVDCHHERLPTSYCTVPVSNQL